MKLRKAIVLGQLNSNSKQVEAISAAIKGNCAQSKREAVWTRSYLATTYNPKELQVRK